jgi:hypothetical protein
MARPSKFTADRCDRFLIALRAGVFPETAARHAGWSPATLYRILRSTSPAHVAFQEDVWRVETELELRLSGTVTQAAFNDPRLALALLERRFGQRWGRRAAVFGGPGERDGSPPPATGVIVVEPAILQTVVPALLAARAGAAATPEALRRVGKFALRSSEEPDE